MNTKTKTTTYYRNFRGFWTRNGRPVKDHMVPMKVRKMAYDMTPECTIHWVS